MSADSVQVKKREIFGYAMAGVGLNMVFTLWSGLTMIFYTDGLRISAAAAGAIIALVRVLDAVIDPLMGTIADQTRTRWGRYRPWLLFMALPIAVMLVLTFWAPDLPYSGKVAYAAVIYALTSLFYSVDVPYSSLPAAMTTDSQTRTVLFTWGRYTTMITILSVAVIGPVIVTVLGGQGADGSVNYVKGSMPTAVVIAAAATVFFLLGFALVREHVAPGKTEKLRISESLGVIFRNRPLLLVLGSFIFANTGMSIRTGFTLYYATNNLGDYTLSAVLSLASIPAIALGLPLAPRLVRRFGKKAMFLASCLFGALVNTLFYFVGYENHFQVYLYYALANLATAFMLVFTSGMVADTVEYAELQTGQRREGLVSSTQTFVNKICLAIAGGLVAYLLTASGYRVWEIQSPATLQTFHFAMTAAIGIGCLLAMIPIFFYPITEKRHAEIVAELGKRKR